MRAPIKVAFVNGGILGLLSYANWVRRAFPSDTDVQAEHFVLSEDVPLVERAIRRVLCMPLVPEVDGWHNVDLGRYRREMNAGLQARRRLLASGVDRFDVLHFHRQATAYASLDLMERTPSIVSIDCTQSCVLQDTTTDRERWSLGFNVRRDGEIFRRACAIVSTSHWAERELRHMYPDCSAPIHVMPNPVPLDVFDRAWTEERRARANPRVQFMFMGGDFPRKGGYDLLDAWVDGGFAGRADLTIVTDWPIRRDIPPGVRLARGIRTQTAEWADVWRAADVFVMPTRNEAFGLVYQEAAAAGLPAIGSCLNAVPEIITEGNTGLLTAPGHRGQLIAAMEAMIASPDRRHLMGLAARHKIELEADPAAHRERILALITQAARRHGQSRS
jgi:glycosyltransferase involved in cell wall biosynthesis